MEELKKLALVVILLVMFTTGITIPVSAVLFMSKNTISIVIAVVLVLLLAIAIKNLYWVLIDEIQKRIK